LKKQLKRWKTDWNNYWDKTSLVMRIVIGALVSLILTYSILHCVTRPLGKEVKTLKKKVNNTAIDDSATIRLEELRQKRERLRKRLAKWEAKLEAGKDCKGSLTEAESGKAIIAIRELFYSCGLKLLEEKRIKARAYSKKKLSSYQKRRKKSKIDTRIKLKLPEYISYISYQFKVHGKFSGVWRFIRRINEISHVFIMNNIIISESSIPKFSNKLDTQCEIEIEFELHIPYLNAVQISSGKKQTSTKEKREII